jgi:predicted kinase
VRQPQSGALCACRGTLLVLAGSKGVGKSWVADIATRRFGVHYVDADVLILDLLERGSSPDPDDGWLNPVQGSVLDALTRYPAVSVEITGAWDSDDKLIRNVVDAGYRVVRIWITAPVEETLARVRARTIRRVAVSDAEARSTYQQAVDRARSEHWDATIETSGAERPDTARAGDPSRPRRQRVTASTRTQSARRAVRARGVSKMLRNRACA